MPLLREGISESQADPSGLANPLTTLPFLYSVAKDIPKRFLPLLKERMRSIPSYIRRKMKLTGREGKDLLLRSEKGAEGTGFLKLPDNSPGAYFHPLTEANKGGRAIVAGDEMLGSSSRRMGEWLGEEFHHTSQIGKKGVYGVDDIPPSTLFRQGVKSGEWKRSSGNPYTAMGESAEMRGAKINAWLKDSGYKDSERLYELGAKVARDVGKGGPGPNTQFTPGEIKNFVKWLRSVNKQAKNARKAAGRKKRSERGLAPLNDYLMGG